MKKRRLIPTLLYRNGQLVQSKQFKQFRNIGNPFKAVERFSDWDADELIYLDISNYSVNQKLRTDLRTSFHGSPVDLLKEIARYSTMPITFGGGIRSLQDIAQRIQCGADKVSVNSLLFSDAAVVADAIDEFGSQAVIASVDVYRSDDKLFALNRFQDYPAVPLLEHIKKVQNMGVGEILLNSVERDGMKIGYDIELIRDVVSMVSIPVIAIGGAGTWEHLSEVFEKTSVDAVSAANIFQWQEQSVNQARAHLFGDGHNIRPPIS
jgi:cyclase